MTELDQSVQTRTIKSLVLLAIIILFFADGGFANGDEAWKSRLAQVEWLNSGTRLHESLKLHKDGTFVIVSVSKKAVSDDDDGERKRFKFAESTIEQTGTWQVLSTSHQLIRLDFVDEPDSIRTQGVRISAIEREKKPQYRFHHVTLIRPKDAPMVSSDRLLVAEGFSVNHDDLARWPDERDISSWLGPATGIDTEKRSLVTDAALKKLASDIPTSWSATRIGNAVVICRGDKNEIHFDAPSGPPLNRAERWNEVRERPYTIVVQFEHRMSPNQRQELKENAASKIATLLPRVEHFKNPPNSKPFGFGYNPKTTQDKTLFEQFRGFQRAIDELPDYYDDKYSVSIEDSLWYYEWILSDAVRKECDDVLDRIEKQFSRYEPKHQ